MNEPKNIDRIFKEGFKEFEAEPPLNSWKSIQSKLEANKTMGNIESYNNKYLKLFHLTASCFFVAITIGITDHLFTKYNTKNNEVNRLNLLDENNQEIITKLNLQKQDLINQNTILKNQLALQQQATGINNKKISTNKNILSTNKPVLANVLQNKRDELVAFNNIIASEIINYQSDFDEENVASNDINSPYIIVDETTGNTMDEKDNIKILNSKNKTTASIIETANGNRVLRINTEDASNSLESKFQKNIIHESYESAIDSIKQNRVVLKVDAKNLSPDELKLINQISESDIKNEVGSFKISARIAPNFIGLNQDKSYIDTQFDANKKNTVLTLSYGLGLEYALTNKFAIRTGIYKQDLEYKTLDVAYQLGSTNANISNLNLTNQGLNTYIETDFNNASNLANTGALNQKMTYLEIPLEVKYNLLAAKVKLDAIAGFSTLFLTQNEVYLKSSYLNSKIGELNNLNKINYSTNLGLSASYKISENIDFQLEPVFKYQLNTTKTKNNYPYTFGLYTGVSYKF